MSCPSSGGACKHPTDVIKVSLNSGTADAVSRGKRYAAHVTLYIEDDEGGVTPSGWSTRVANGANKVSHRRRHCTFQLSEPNKKQTKPTNRHYWFVSPPPPLECAFGRIFYVQDEPFRFSPGVNLIEGWTEGVLEMSVGERAQLHIPSAKGYGARAMGSQNGPFFIPANSDLMFDIEILSVV